MNITTKIACIPFEMKRRIFLATSVLAAFSGNVLAAQKWTDRPVNLIVPSGAGSAPDTYARALADQLNRSTGGIFVVDNKAAASGNLAAETVMRALPDGGNLLIGTQALMTINPCTFPQLRWKSENFTPLAKGVEAPLVLVTHPSVPAKDFAELGVWIKSQKAKAAYASFSAGTPSHFLGYQLNELLMADMVHVPYKGSSAQVSDILGGQVMLGFTQLATAEPHIRAGKLKAFAVTSPRRVKQLSSIPTVAELGMPELTTSVWFGVFASSSTPKPMLDSILKAVTEAQADARLRSRLEAQGFSMAEEVGPDFSKAIAAETIRWAQVVKASGFKAIE